MGVRIGIREPGQKVASYMESTVPIEVTRHGQTVGWSKVTRAQYKLSIYLSQVVPVSVE